MPRIMLIEAAPVNTSCALDCTGIDETDGEGNTDKGGDGSSGTKEGDTGLSYAPRCWILNEVGGAPLNSVSRRVVLGCVKSDCA